MDLLVEPLESSELELSYLLEMTAEYERKEENSRRWSVDKFLRRALYQKYFSDLETISEIREKADELQNQLEDAEYSSKHFSGLVDKAAVARLKNLYYPEPWYRSED